MRWLKVSTLSLVLLLLLPAQSWAAVAFRATAQSTVATGTSIVVTKPTGTVDNDVMVAVLYRETNAAITQPGGWTLVCTADNIGTAIPNEMQMWVKRAASEGANYTWSWTGSEFKQGNISTYSGVITSGDPVDTFDCDITAASQTASPTLTISTTVANTMLVWGASNYNEGTWTFPTTPGAFTQRGTSSAAGLGDYLWSGSGASGNIIGGIGTASFTTAGVIALKPPAAGGPDVTPFYKRKIR